MIAKISRLRTVVMGLALMSLVALISMTVTTSAQVEATVPQPMSAETIPCPMNLPEGDIDGETMICGQIEVPENWDNPGENTLVITYAIARANNESPFADPIIFFEGGPGISALEEIELLVDGMAHLRRTRDIIYFDQRGIRFSSPLECPPEIRNTVNEIQIPEDIDVDAFSETINNVTLDSDVDALLEAADILGPGDLILNCAPYLEEQGVELSQYSSYSNALDSIALMDALDYPSYNLYGISYGTNHTLEVMRYYDENEGADLPAVRSVVIDGVLGSWIDFVRLNALGRPVVVLNAFEACEADDACSASYPNIRQRAIDLLAEVEADPLVIDDSTTITLGDLNAVLKSNASDPAGLVYLPRLIDELEQGNADLYLLLQDGTLPVVSETLPEIGTPFDPISLEADSVATQMRILADEVESLSALSERLSEAYRSGVALPQFFADELADGAEQLPQAPLNEITAYFQSVPDSAPDRNQLLEAVSVFPDAERNLLISLIGLMDDEDIAEVYAILADPLYSERFPNRYTVIEQLIHCNDRGFDLANAFETLRAFDAPQLIQGDPIDYGFGARCAGYGVSGSPLDPVVNTSGFPVFVSNGAVDGLTPKIFGESIYANLENARMITFPNLGHGATRKSACSRDITNAFFMYPEREFNDSCVESLRPVFVLPDDPLPTE